MISEDSVRLVRTIITTVIALLAIEGAVTVASYQSARVDGLERRLADLERAVNH